MGSALDAAFNTLLIDKDLEKAKREFTTRLMYADVNKKNVYIPTSHLITYSKSDFDEDLLLPEDVTKFNMIKIECKYEDTASVGTIINELTKKKGMVGLNGLAPAERTLLALGNYLSLARKGILMLEAYHTQVLPRIVEVLSVQEQITLVNSDGDEITGFIDFVAKLSDGNNYILDNKTSSSMAYYPQDSAGKSQQLIIYKHAVQEKYGIDGVGYIVILKNMFKNKAKSCSKCKTDGTGKRHKTCDVVIGEKRCNGEWIETMKPEAHIEWILNTVTPAAEDLVIEAFDLAAHGIKAEVFNPNLGACNSPFPCVYQKLCWNGDSSDLESLPEETK